MSEKKDFFISYNRADQRWANWIAWELEEAGYSVIVQSWDFLPGQNFVIRMHEAIQAAGRIIAVLSPEFLKAAFGTAEWAAAFQQDPTGAEGVLLPVRVRACDMAGLLPQVIHVDLVGKTREEARAALIHGAGRRRRKPVVAPTFPPDSKDGEDPFEQALDVDQQESPLAAQRGSSPSAIAGRWVARFTYVDGQTYQEVIDLEDDVADHFIGRIVPSWDNCIHTASVDHLRPL